MLRRFALAGSALLAAGALAASVPALKDGPDLRAQALEQLLIREAPHAGGSGDDFDWHVPAGATVLLDTSHATIRGGPGGAPTRMLEVLGGIVEVRDLVVPAGATIEAQGPNPLVIFASGDVHIDGRISVDGGDRGPVYTINAPFTPEQGAPGNAGGGHGGTGSRLIDRSDPQGAPGSGPFGVPDIGGQGGESGWHPSNGNDGVNRRAAGGGGGVFARDARLANGCLDQTLIGLDAEDGFPGSQTANAALRPGEIMPWGGRRGRGPFVNGDARDDFFGLMLANADTPDEELVIGELPHPWAGAGGGGGGDATWTDIYPPAQFIYNREDKGCGGGGGAGALSIYARGDIVLGPTGRLTADGGHGSGGENTNYVNRIGGGSGGGSGGHIVLQSLGHVDLSALPPDLLAISARGGQGGAGAQNAGGADDNETVAAGDAKHVGVTGPGDLSDNPWIPQVPVECQSGQGVVRAAGGDGGPGLIQFHVRDLDAILSPGGDPAKIRFVVRPAPVGYATPGDPVQDFIDLLLPRF